MNTTLQQGLIAKTYALPWLAERQGYSGAAASGGFYCKSVTAVLAMLQRPHPWAAPPQQTGFSPGV